MAIRRMGPPPSSTAAKPALKPLHPAPRPETINPRSPNRKVMVGDGPQVRRPDREAQNKATNKLPKRAAAPSKVNQRLPDPIRAEKGLSLVGLMRKQPRYIINSAEVIVIRDYKPKTTRGGMPAVIGATRDMDTKPLRPHKFKVVGLDPSINTITKQKRIKVSCDCVTGDTRVLTSQGWKTIFDIAEEFNPESLPFDYVIRGKNYQGTAPYYKGKQPVWELTAANGRKIKATKDHKFLVYSGNKKVWRTLERIRVGDRMVVDSFEAPKADTDSLAYAEGYFLGVLMGDGTVTGSGNPDLQLYGYKHSLVETLEKARVVDVVNPSARDGLRVTFNHRARELMVRYGFKNKEGVNLTDTDRICGYLSGLLATDGTITKEVSISGGLSYLTQAQEYLMQMGCGRTSIFRTAKTGDETNYGKRNKDCYMVKIHASDLANIVDNLVLPQFKSDRLQTILNRTRRKSRGATVVRSIAYAGRQHVYDITVPGPTRFNANGFTAHNCEFFTFYCEYALWTWGAANIEYSNGQPAVVRNSGNVPLVCKHLSKILMTIRERGD